MIELELRKELGESDPKSARGLTISSVLEFLECSDPFASELPKDPLTHVCHLWDVIDQFSKLDIWDAKDRAFVVLALRRSLAGLNPNFIKKVIERIARNEQREGSRWMSWSFIELALVVDYPPPELAKIIGDSIKGSVSIEYEISDGGPCFKSGFTNFIWSFPDDQLTDLVKGAVEGLLPLFLKYRTNVADGWASRQSSGKRVHWFSWASFVEGSSSRDQEVIELIAKAEVNDGESLFRFLVRADRVRPDVYRPYLHEHLRLPNLFGIREYCSVLVRELPEEAISIYRPIVQSKEWRPYLYPLYRDVFGHAGKRIEGDGILLIQDLRDSGNRYFQKCVLDAIIDQTPDQGREVLGPELSRILEIRPEDEASELEGVFSIIADRVPSLVEADLWSLLGNRSKNIRGIAAGGLASISDGKIPDRVRDLLKASRADSRLGAVELLNRIGSQSVPLLKSAHETEKSQKVQKAIEETFTTLGVDIAWEAELSGEQILEQIEQDRRIKLPLAKWFDFSRFSLVQKSGSALSDQATTFLIQKQSKHKALEAAPGVLPLLELLDREKNADAALALVEQFLDSDQEAKDRWALTLGGLLGDNRIITALTPRIQPWCEAARHKLAEYAAQAIALLGTEEALMILDTLANRYRSKFKNIGKACRGAFQKAAEIRGVSEDELGDLVVPDLGFNSEGHKEFDDGKIIAVLQPDFKITWLNPETEKETKSPPSTLSEEGKAELKVLRKILREAVKSQTARFEQMLVRQRRWPVGRWQELFEEHPLLQSYASSLVWGIYDGEGKLLRTFRRYPNGILAHGSGEMEDLEEQDTLIGIVHPLDLDEESLAVWREHLGRFKVKPPFDQIDRQVELVEDGHGNRREIGITDQVTMSYGTFNGRTSRLGWIRGSVIEGGSVVSYYKPFHGAGVEAILMMWECWAGMESMEEVSMGKALFAKIDSVERGSYVYDDPEPDDPRVLSFGEVPAIVYSETIADLKAIMAGQDKS